MFKLGLDIHGVISKDPTLFKTITEKFIAHGDEVHIITGVELTPDIITKLESYGIVWSKIFSITTYHKKIGTPMIFKDSDPTQPLIDNELWDITKAVYCAKNKIDVHIDDSKEYEKYFRTIGAQYLCYSEQVKYLLKTLMTVN